MISLSFGFEGGWPLLPPDIAVVMNLSSKRVRQVQREALQKLREKAGMLISLLS